MKKVLGLDLGVGSVGWSLVNVDDNYKPTEILGIGSRIISLSPDESSEFTSGNAASKNQKRTQKRTARKGYDRYQMRRQALTEKLRELKMLPDERLIKLPVLELWTLRAKAATPGEKLTLPEIGRVLYHINQKRGYRHAKSDDSADKEQRDYVQTVNKRYQEIKDEGTTIGQHFAIKLKESEIVTDKGPFYNYRIKEQVFPRDAYIEEFDRIMDCQKTFYPEELSEDNIDEIRNKIIFYQRDLKSCKHLVSQCEFMTRSFLDAEHKPILNSSGELVMSGPKVAPKSSPIFQACKIWEEINNLSIRNKENDELHISPEQKKDIFEYLDNNEKINATALYKILGIGKGDGWSVDKALSKGFTGNTTKVAIAKALGKEHNTKKSDLLRFDLSLKENGVNKDTGEIIYEIDPACENEPLYRLWHVIYSINDKDALRHALTNQFGINDEESLHKIPQLQKNELRQPVVEKILNQMINVVNAVIDQFGSIDEIRVEMARELKLSKEGRAATAKNIRDREKMNNEMAEKIKELGITPSKNKILKYRLWQESGQKCFYCGQPVGAAEFLSGLDVEIEHIVPKSLLFDDSFSNKVCACRKCNAEKSNTTAYDYMKSKGENEFNDYLRRVDAAFNEHKISFTKRSRLLTPADKLPKDFISRQLVQTQYISRKAMEILKQVCHNVYGSSGEVTSYLRRIWGYDEILHSLDLPRYREGGMTAEVSYDHRGQTHTEERIKDWSKRLDHRHHAIDALTIACTRQSIIQRLNNLSAMTAVAGESMSLDKWTLAQPHFSVQKVSDNVSRILVSFKAGKKVTTPGKRYIYRGGKRVLAQEGLLIPRGALCEESVYGRIHSLEKEVPVKKLFERVDDIVKPGIRAAVEERLRACDNDVKVACASLKKEPLYLDVEKTIPLEYGTCYKAEYVMRYALSALKPKDVEFIVDEHIRKVVSERLSEYGNDPKKAFAEPLYADKSKTIPIRAVRCYTGLAQVVPVKKDSKGNAIGFVKPGNNHHIAIYRDADGTYHESVVTFWDTVERKKYGLPVIIRKPEEIWDIIIDKNIPEELAAGLPAPDWKFVMSMQQNEMYVLGMEDDEFRDAMEVKDYKTLGAHLYRVQNISSLYYVLRLQYETQVDNSNEALNMKKFHRIRSFNALFALHPRKVSVSLLGEMALKDD